MEYPVFKVIFVLASGNRLEVEVERVKGFLIRPVHPDKRRDRLTLLDQEGTVLRTEPLGDFLENIRGIGGRP